MACRFDPCYPHHTAASFILLAAVLLCVIPIAVEQAFFLHNLFLC